MADAQRLLLSAPHMSGLEEAYVQEVFQTNGIAPWGTQVSAFEQEFAATLGLEHAVAVSSGTAALHLALILAGVREGDEVLVSTLTFAASVNPILYCGGRPVFIDSETRSWNMDPLLLAATLEQRAAAGRLPRAVVVVHLYGQTADLEPILTTCSRFAVPVVEDAAEALGATYREHPAGTLGQTGCFSFNGNKIITTSGGGMLVSADRELVDHARKLAAQARDDAPHYQHSEVGYNYRLSNVLAAIGRGQLPALSQRVEARRQNYERYALELGDCPGIRLQPDAGWGIHTRWLTAITIDPERFGADREQVRLALAARNIESRPVWKPMHLQPVFQRYESVRGQVAERLFAQGLCLPSGSSLTAGEIGRVAAVVRGCYRGHH